MASLLSMALSPDRTRVRSARRAAQVRLQPGQVRIADLVALHVLEDPMQPLAIEFALSCQVVEEMPHSGASVLADPSPDLARLP